MLRNLQYLYRRFDIHNSSDNFYFGCNLRFYQDSILQKVDTKIQTEPSAFFLAEKTHNSDYLVRTCSPSPKSALGGLLLSQL